MKFSVVVVTYRRLQRLNLILSEWLKETDDVWLCDCSGDKFKTSLPVNIVSAWPDPGNCIRHAVALMTFGDLVIKADDDVMPKSGITADFAKHYPSISPCIMGIHGRRFNGPRYYNDTKLFGGKNVNIPTRVDFVGIMTCSPRKFLPMDLYGCGSEIEDLFWQMKKYPEVSKYVIPTSAFHHLEESKDHGRLCGDGQSRMIRREFYARWFNKNYAYKPRIV